MSRYSKMFLVFFVFLFMGLFSIVVDQSFTNTQKVQDIQNFTSISTLPNTIVSTSYFEPRIKEYKDSRYKLYDNMLEIDYMSFSRN